MSTKVKYNTIKYDVVSTLFIFLLCNLSALFFIIINDKNNIDILAITVNPYFTSILQIRLIDENKMNNMNNFSIISKLKKVFQFFLMNTKNIAGIIANIQTETGESIAKGKIKIATDLNKKSCEIFLIILLSDISIR